MIKYELIFDIGNSFVKLALFRNGVILRFKRCEEISKSIISEFLEGVEPQLIGVASVAGAVENFAEIIRPFGIVKFIDSMCELPITTTYISRETLGVDRIANAVAVHCFANGSPALAVDTGTCLTYDFVDASGIHQGGAISPGIRLRALAMHEHSARLPYVIPELEPLLIGNNTESSIASGIFNGIIAEIDGTIDRYRTEYPNLCVVITGGDALSFQRVIKNAIFADPLLTLKGIHEILVNQ